MTLQFPLPNVPLAPRAPSIPSKPFGSVFSLTLFCLIPAASALAATPASSSVMLEELTSTELRSRIDHGATTVLVPIGGVEQSGPYIALGKHLSLIHI